MDLKKFLARLGVEPRSQDPAFLKASRASLDHAREYSEAQAFEDKLQAAIELPAQPQLAESIISNLGLEPSASRSTGGGWLALAASVLVIVGAASFYLPDRSADAAIRKAFIAHLDHPEPALTSRLEVSDDSLAKRFADRGVVLRKPVPNVSYVSPCVIGGTPGLHLVMTDADDQQITFMLMPGSTLEHEHNFSTDDMTVRIAETHAGAIALIGHQGQDLGGAMRDLLRNIDGPQRRIAAL